MYSSSEHSLVDHYVDVPPGFDFDAEFDDGVVSPGHREDRDTRHAPCNDCQLFGESIFYERLEAGLCVVLDEGLPRFQRYAQQGRLIELGYVLDGVTRCWWPKGVMVQCIESKPSISAEAVPAEARWNIRNALRPFWAFAALGLVTGNIAVQLLH